MHLTIHLHSCIKYKKGSIIFQIGLENPIFITTKLLEVIHSYAISYYQLCYSFLIQFSSRACQTLIRQIIDIFKLVEELCQTYCIQPHNTK